MDTAGSTCDSCPGQGLQNLGIPTWLPPHPTSSFTLLLRAEGTQKQMAKALSPQTPDCPLGSCKEAPGSQVLELLHFVPQEPKEERESAVQVARGECGELFCSNWHSRAPGYQGRVVRPTGSLLCGSGLSCQLGLDQ